jgi:adenylate cyclase
MQFLFKHGPRIGVTLVPLLFALLHAMDWLPIGAIKRLDDVIYDARLTATMPRTLDERIVIADIDEKSLAEFGRWPWSRNLLAKLMDELFDRQKIAVLGFDVVFAEPDDSSGLKRLRQLAQDELRDQPSFATKLAQIQGSLDYDALFAKALEKRAVVMGFYLTDASGGRATGVLPAPVMDKDVFKGRPVQTLKWDSYGSNIEILAKAAPLAGFFNTVPDGDGVVRSVPLIAEYNGQYYESLSLAIFRVMLGLPAVAPGFAQEKLLAKNYQGLESVLLKRDGKSMALPVDIRGAALAPYRGRGGVNGGSFRYISISDLLAGRIPAGQMRDKVVIVGTTAPGLLDLRVTPVDEAYPGVEAHANLISGFMDGKVLVKPDYALGYDVLLLLLAGLTLAFGLPMLSALRAILLSVAVAVVLVGLNLWLYAGAGLVLPLAGALLMTITAFGLNMSYGYFVESRSKRQLANLFGTYVPPELVDEMVKDPAHYSMAAANKELTVMFSDMRGFTKMSETMEPIALQGLLNGVFSRLTNIIRSNRGTIDKYMGDCVMAFWGAPVDLPEHAELAVKTAMEMAAAIVQLNEEHRAKGIPEIGVGVGLNTGMMCVGDMGSDLRQSYTVVGDAVNLGSRLEGLSKTYGVSIVVSEATKKLVPSYAWQELDKVRVKGKDLAVTIFRPVGLADQLDKDQAAELKLWAAFLRSYRSQEWDQCELHLLNLKRISAENFLYSLYSERVNAMKMLPFDPSWDGATNFETK